jgi:hypothetical protein
MTLIISVGKYGGFYLERGRCPRICLGWIAFTIWPEDFDFALEEIVKKWEKDE